MEENQSLRILFVEDVAADAELAERALRKAGLVFTSTRVETKDAFLNALVEFQPDLVISDYAMPGFDGMQALKLSLAHDAMLPFIILTSRDEETAVACMKAGATDYVIKQRMTRLPFTVRDALEQKKSRLATTAAERALRESEAKFRVLAETAPATIFIFQETRNVYVNPAAVALTGYSADELLAMNFWEIIHPDFRAEVKARGLARQHNEFVPAGYELKLVTKSGQEHWVDFNAGVIEFGAQPAVIGTAFDITERKRAEEALTRMLEEAQTHQIELQMQNEELKQVHQELDVSLEKYFDLYELAPTGYMTLDAAGTILEANLTAATLLGVTKSDLVEQQLTRFILLEDQNIYYLYRKRLFDTRARQTCELRIVRKDGTLRWVSIEAKVTTDSDDTPILWAALGDITERKHTEEVLHASTTQLETLIHVSPPAIILLDANGNVQIWNPAAERIFGWTAREAIGHQIPIVPAAKQDEHKVWSQQVIQGNPLNNQESIRQRKDGSLVDVSVSSALVYDSVGNVAGRMAVIADITERKQAEEALRRSNERLNILREIDKSIVQAHSPQAIADGVVKRIRQLIPCRGANVTLFDPAANTMTILASELDGDPTLHAGQDWAIFPDWLAQLGAGQITVIDDARGLTDPSPLLQQLISAGLTTFLHIPLMAQTQLVGALNLTADTPGAFTTEHQDIAGEIANQLAIAIHQARLSEQTVHHLQHVQALRKVEHAVTTSFDLRLTLGIVVEQALESLHVQAADVLRYNPHTLELTYDTGRGFRTPAIATTRLRLGESYAGRAAQERALISVTDFAEPGGAHIRPPLYASEGFATYFGVPLVAKGELKGVLEVFHRAPFTPHHEWLDLLTSFAAQSAIAIDNAELFEGLQLSNLELNHAYDATIEGWSRALELRDEETQGHTQRVTDLSLRLARAMGLRDDALVHFRRGALLHDIGKMGVPDSILLKRGKLTDAEWVMMRRHPQFAYDLLARIAYLHPVLDIPHCHHERWDGTGYPRGLRGDEIPLAARLFAIVDVWDALTSDRPYRLAWSKAKALEHIRAQARKHFDPQVVNVFLDTLADVTNPAG